ncbi:alpha/beta hydrolase [Amycolatopsis sp., V23-08]|uniref:Alpha/beta hydrolase n=1 Tax=Amycolatopsis heterodermiae TaxID=3110235 RepID=A0ABU5R3Y1_9PSEU|nr:alpha/beta hydrolase [Amycolatopsis sp., V23-08]MEA5360912.1 alpha/beta hydrolase [Amycolatopsis sp., V23-08]
MTFTVDPQVAAILAPMAEAMAAAPHPAVGDVATRRVALEAMMAETAALQPTPADVTTTDFHAVAGDGTKVLLRWYTKEGAAPGPAVLYLHGGGMILGSVALYDAPIARYVSASGVPMLAVDYRLAPEHPDPTPVEDVYTGLRWLHDHAAELGVDPARIAVMGDSAGGGLAAGVTLLARDRGGPAVARQILVFPMLDDRTTTPDPELVPFATWTYEDNVTGWSALLGARAGGPDVSPYAAAARAADLSGLPPTYLEVGQLDIFRDEDLDYARRLGAAGVDVEFHLHPGVPHEFETFAWDTGVARRAVADRLRVLGSL